MRRSLLFFIVVLLLAGAAAITPSFSEVVGPDTGSVSITSTPQGAAVTIDGTSVGTTPVMGLQLGTGDHSVTATLSGYQQATQDFTLNAGEDKAISLNLAPLVPTIPFVTTVPVTIPITQPITLPTTEPVTITIPTTDHHSYDRAGNHHDPDNTDWGWKRLDYYPLQRQRCDGNV